MAALIEAQKLTKHFTIGRGQVVHAVDGVSLAIAEREVVGLVGESGSGKSTFGRTLVGLYEKTGGDVSFAGERLPAKYAAADFRRFASQIQMIFQDPYSSLNPRMTVVEIIGEGLAIGSAFALGQATLGTLLIVGFTLHNTTEGLAIDAPLAREKRRPSIGDLVKLGLIGGAPTIAGAWLGGFVYSPVWSVLFLAIGVGAIAQVIGQIGRQMRRETSTTKMLASGPVLAGLVAGFAVMYITGMLVG